MSKNILLVEDSPQLLRLIGDYLKIRGYGVRTATTAAEALAALQAEPADLVIVDGVLPGDMDGLGLITEIRGRVPSPKIVAMSGHPQLLPLLAETGVAVLTKPFNMKALDRCIRKALTGD